MELEDEPTVPDPTNERLLQELLETLRDNKQSVSKKLEELDSKLAALPTQLEVIRREQRDTSDALRREFTASLDAQRREFSSSQLDLRRELQTYFVPRSEYDPKHAVILDKIKEYDTLISESRNSIAEYERWKARIENIENALKEKSDKGSAAWVKVGVISSIIVSVLSVMLQYAQHINFH